MEGLDANKSAAESFKPTPWRRLPFTDGGKIVFNERVRQVSKWGLLKDQEYVNGELALAASILLGFCTPMAWPFSDEEGYGYQEFVARHPDREEQLAIAGAWCAAEIDRLYSLKQDYVAAYQAQQAKKSGLPENLDPPVYLDVP